MYYPEQDIYIKLKPTNRIIYIYIKHVQILKYYINIIKAEGKFLFSKIFNL